MPDRRPCRTPGTSTGMRRGARTDRGSWEKGKQLRATYRGSQAGQEISPRLLARGFPPERVTGIDAALLKLPRCSDAFRRA